LTTNQATLVLADGALLRYTVNELPVIFGTAATTYTPVVLRGQGGSWPQPGDPLAGQPTAYLLRAAASAAADGEALEHAVTGALRIDTDRLSVAEAADVIAARTGWPTTAG
jgi:hypothetical protein